jgi:hypothetical protein
MPSDATPAKPRGLALMLGWRRIAVALGASALVGLVVSPAFVSSTSTLQVIGRELVVGTAALLAFGIFEQWPARLPRWLARWALQVIAVAVVVPATVFAQYLALGSGDGGPFWTNAMRLNGFAILTLTGLLVAPWVAVAALFRQRDESLRNQAVAFALERGELERKALDSRLRLLQAQVQPHFLFNTLANVRELVVSGSPQAATVLDSLIAYLRAAVPRLDEPATTVEQELQLVRAYLELMYMRMPDRLKYEVQADDAALKLRCPPTTLLTLVENAVRHGIDPGEEGGRIEVRVRVREGRCHAEVVDTGVGLQVAPGGLGTGLSTLRERLQLVFGNDAQLRIAAIAPHGTRVEVGFPAQAGPA